MTVENFIVLALCVILIAFGIALIVGAAWGAGGFLQLLGAWLQVVAAGIGLTALVLGVVLLGALLKCWDR